MGGDGSLGFLLPFAFKNFKVAIDQLLEKQVPILKRMRLGYTVYFGNNVCETPNIQAMNELTVHRGRNAQLAVMDCYVGDEHLTDVVADGLIVSTPTGSTAYSLSAGGPIVHPLVDSIVLTPICPRSLSFRPIILPADVKVTLRVSSKSRDDVHVSVDGQEVFKLTPEHHLEVFCPFK
ncbi:NADH kinase pos5 [Globomyces sp. JEL0801]|nr:NADH kinase pos5 [Globomyces sp. JEL0801]